MITKADLIKYDRSQMCNIYDQWPKIAKNAYNLEIEQIDLKKYQVLDNNDEIIILENKLNQ